MMVEMIATFRLRIRESTRPASANGCSQFWRVNCCHTALNRPFGSLKLNATMTKIGMKRYTNAAPAAVLISARPMRPPRDVTVPLEPLMPRSCEVVRAERT